MATVKENLIAAKALIDTPEKFVALGRSTLESINRVTGRETLSNQACIKAMRGASGMVGTDWSCHREVMAHFDRAIAAQDEDRLQTRDQMLRGLTP